MKKIGIFSGSFDPITNGHLWVIEEGKKLFDEFHVLIGPVPKRNKVFSSYERKAMIDTLVKPPVIVDILYTNNMSGYISKLDGEVFLFRGIRNEDDAAYELGIVQCLRAVGENCHFVFVTPPNDLEMVSSSHVKDLCTCGYWDEVAKEVPPNVVDELKKYFKNRSSNWIVAQQAPTSIFETTTAGFAPTPNETFTSSIEPQSITLFSNNSHKIKMVDELEEILNKLKKNKVNIQFFGKMRDNFKQLEANGFIKFADAVAAEQVRMMLDPCHIDVVSSEQYLLTQIPLDAVRPLDKERFLPCSQSLGPIIVDLKPKGLEWNQELPSVVIIEGKHRWLDAQERGDKTIMAYVGNKALKYFKVDYAD